MVGVPIVPSYPHIFSSMVGVFHRPLLPFLPTPPFSCFVLSLPTPPFSRFALGWRGREGVHPGKACFPHSLAMSFSKQMGLTSDVKAVVSFTSLSKNERKIGFPGLGWGLGGLGRGDAFTSGVGW